MKRKLSLILAALLLASTVCSCSSEDPKQPSTTTAEITGNDSSPSDTTAEVAIKINPNLAENNYDGYEFVILSRWLNNGDWTPDWDPRDIDAEDQNGEPINDAVYLRNQMVEERYNVTITEDRREWISSDFQKALRNEIATGDNTFDVVLPSIKDGCAAYAVDGNFLDLLTIENLDLTQPWWDQNSVKATIGNKLYLVEGDMLVNYKDATSAMVFNKKLYGDNTGYEDIYKLVTDGKWTFDKLYEYMKDYAGDANGDSKMDENDRYGLICQVDSMPSFLNSAGELYAVKDENDMPVMSINNESAVSKMEKIFDIMYSPDARNSHKLEGKANIYDVAANAFKENRTLFMWIRMMVVSTLRDMEVDFGIVPIPKYDEDQTTYYATVNVNTGYGICVPVTAKDPARTGMLLEALCSASYNNLTTAYYETTLEGKIIRDEESSAMLDIIFANTVYDIGQIYNFGGIDDQFMSLSRTDNRNFASMYAKLEKAINKAIEKLAKNLEKLDS